MITLTVVGGPNDGDEIVIPGNKPPMDYVFPYLVQPTYFNPEEDPPLTFDLPRRICPVRTRRMFKRYPGGSSQEWYDYAIDWYGGRDVT